MYLLSELWRLLSSVGLDGQRPLLKPVVAIYTIASTHSYRVQSLLWVFASALCSREGFSLVGRWNQTKILTQDRVHISAAPLRISKSIFRPRSNVSLVPVLKPSSPPEKPVYLLY